MFNNINFTGTRDWYSNNAHNTYKKVLMLVGVIKTITCKKVISSLFGPIEVTIQNDMLNSVFVFGYTF